MTIMTLPKRYFKKCLGKFFNGGLVQNLELELYIWLRLDSPPKKGVDFDNFSSFTKCVT